MKILLIFSPFVSPSYIPLGIAQLKSFIKKQLPSIKILNLDLNNRFLNNLLKKNFLEKLFIASRTYPEINKYKKDYFFNDAMIFKVGVDCLKDKKTGMFYDISKYNYFISKIFPFWNQQQKFVDFIAQKIIEEDLPIGPEIENMVEDDLKMIAQANPDFVGFSLFCLDQLSYSLILAKIIKKKLKLPIIFGGALMNYLDIQEFLDFFDVVDFVISKEGEIGLVEFAKNFPKKNFHNVPGLYYRQGGKVLFNSERFIKDLDRLPFPDFNDFKLSRYLFPFPVLPVNFSRGCYWKKCTFCTYQKKYPMSYKTKSIEKFIAEIKFYNSRGINHFFIDDDVISASDLNAISIALRQNKIKIFFGAIVRAENGFSHNVLKNIHSAGGRVLVWGVESSCQRILDLMGKGTKSENIRLILKRSCKNGIYNHLFMIQGFPTQTEREIYKDFDFLINNRDVIQGFFYHRFSLQRGSYISHDPEKFKIKIIKTKPLYLSKKKNTALHSWWLNYKSGVKLDWKRIQRKEKEIEHSGNRFQKYKTMEHSHALLHASYNSE